MFLRSLACSSAPLVRQMSKGSASKIIKSPYAPLEIAPGCTVYNEILRNIDHYGDTPAFKQGLDGRVYSYKEVKHGILRTASGLAARGLRRGDVVALCTPNCPEYAMIYNGVNMAGGVNTTVNYGYTEKEFTYQLKASGASYIVATHEQLPLMQKIAKDLGTIKEIIVIGKSVDGALGYDDLINNHSPIPKWHNIDSKNEISVIPFSSGTTGLPKGVLLTQHNLVANLKQLIAVDILGPKDNIVAVLPFYHIYGLMMVMNGGLIRGICQTTCPKFDFETFLKIIQEHKITMAHLVPPIILGLAKHPLVDKYNLSSLGAIISGAAPLDAALQRAASKRLGHIPIRQGYGMTEASPLTHFTPLYAPKDGSIGVLVPNMEAKIVGENGEVVGVDQPGELRMRGDNIMKGYLNITDDSFDEEGFYKSGDVAKIDKDGYFYILDRMKELIKYKGLQVAPAELEGVLLSHPDVSDSCVVGIPDDVAGEVPRAYVVAKQGKTLTESEIHAHMDKHVAHHKKLRGGIVFTDVIPKSASGKILRRLLRDRALEEIKK